MYLCVRACVRACVWGGGGGVRARACVCVCVGGGGGVASARAFSFFSQLKYASQTKDVWEIITSLTGL